MTGQKFLEGLVAAARNTLVENYRCVVDVQEIEGGLLLTMADGRQYRIDAVEIGRNKRIKSQKNQRECFGDWSPGSMICILVSECKFWQECTAIWKRKQEAGRV